MANRRTEPVSYRPFRVEPQMQDGLLAVAREGGDLERKVAMGFARFADQMGERADRERALQGRRDGERDALAGAPTGATFEGGDLIGTASPNGQAGHVRGSQGGIRVSARGGNAAAAAARDYLVKKHGFSPIAAAAVAGHGMQESGFDLGAVGDNGTAFGALQWRGDRLSNLKAFARSQGREWNSLETQLDFTVHELQTSERRAGTELAAATTIDDAVAAFMHFERPQGYTADNPRGGHAFGNRLAYAKGLAGDSSYSELPSASSVAPVSVTAVREPVSITPGKSGTFRPRGGNTIYDLAYDVAGTRTYLEMADAAMVENQQAIYEAYKDNPSMLQKALDEGLTADLQDNIFEEIAPEYTVAYRKRSASLLDKARAEQRQREEQQNRADFLTRTGELETVRARQLVGLDPNDPSAARQLADTQAQLDAHYDSAVARGVLDADDAAAFKQRSRSEMTVGFYLSQSKGMPADKIDAMRADMQKDFASGALEGVTAADWPEIEKGLIAAASARRTQDGVATEALRQRGNDLVNRIARGLPVSPDELSRFQLDIGTATNGREIANSTFARIRVADALRKQPLSVVERDLEKILKGNGDTIDPADTEFARKTIAEFRQAVLTDPLGKAEAIGLIPPVAAIPVDGTATPEDIASAVAYRRGAAEGVARHFGIQPRYFRPGEADAVMKAAEENPEALVVFTQSVRDAFGKDAAKALSEFSESGPALAHAAGLSIATGDVGIARDVATTLQLKRRKELPDLTPDTIRKASALGASTTAGAFLADPRTQNATLQTAQLLFEQDAARLGIDPSEVKTAGSTAETTYLKALDRALGGRVVNGEAWGGIDEVNGFKIVTPSDMPKGRPQSLIENLTDAQLKALPPIASNTGYPVTASQISSGYLVSAGDGRYRVALGDPTGDEPRYLTTPDGGYWVLDIRALAAAPRDTGMGSPNASEMGDVLLWGVQ